MLLFWIELISCTFAYPLQTWKPTSVCRTMVVVGRTLLLTLLRAGYLVNSILCHIFVNVYISVLQYMWSKAWFFHFQNCRTLSEEEYVNAQLYKMCSLLVMDIPIVKVTFFI